MFHQNMTIKLWLVIWLTFIGLYFVIPQSDFLDQENFVLPIMENTADEALSPQGLNEPMQRRPALGNTSTPTSMPVSDTDTHVNDEVNGVVGSAVSSTINDTTNEEEFADDDTTASNAGSDSYIPNANLPYIPDLEIGVTERAQVLNTLGRPARQLQQGKVLEYYFSQHSETLQVISEEESNLIIQNEIDLQSPMYHLMIEFDMNNVIMAMNMQPL
ncbi:hypothetical protein [Thalassotalea litorea]|uniref:hypothetical protein n=1 Tax=Thalassotalea litorea TaxID=2020715 RepID=UPI0037361F5B